MNIVDVDLQKKKNQMKQLIVKVVLNNEKKFLIIERKIGDWSILEEIGAFDVLRQRAHEKLNKIFDIKKRKK